MAIPGTPAGLAPAAHPARESGRPGAGSRTANPAAIRAVVIGALSLFIGVLGPVAIVTGLRARRAGAGWLALIAIITGAVSTGFLLLGIAHYLLAALA